MSKKKNNNTALISIIVILVLIIIGAGIYIVTSKSSKNTSVSTSSTKVTKSLQGNSLISSDFTNLESQVPTVTDYYLADQNSDLNKLMGKPHQYLYLGYYYDSRTGYAPTDDAGNTIDIKDNHTGTNAYGTEAGGAIEVFANNADAKVRSDYLNSFGSSGALSAGANRVIDNVVLRVSTQYTASQQTEMLNFMEKNLSKS